MTIPLYIDLGTPGHPVYASTNHAPLAPITLNLRETHTFLVTYGIAGIKEAMSGERRLVLKAGPEGSVLAQDASATSVGTGVDSFTFIVDSSQLRSLLDGKTEAAVILQVEMIATDDTVRLSQPVPIIIRTAYATAADGIPDPAGDAAYALLAAILQEGDAVSFDLDAAARLITINFDPGGELTAEDGWTPALRIVTDGSRRVMELYDWANGTGTKPATGYITSSGALTSTLSAGADIRGATGATGATGNKGWSPQIRNVTDGDRRVMELYDWTGGEGTKPGTGYISSSGLTSTIGDALDMRGATGPSGGDPGADGDNGWMPVHALIEDGERRVLQLISWFGGTGTAPTDYINEYLSASGYTSTLAAAVDLRGAQGDAATVDHPRTYYVEAESGTDDMRSGAGTFLAPWATLEYALIQTATETDPITIHIGAGNAGTITADPALYDLLTRDVTIIGQGCKTSSFNVAGGGAPGTTTPSNQTASPSAMDGANGNSVRLFGNRTVTIISCDTFGGYGGATSDPGAIGGVIAGKGGNAGTIALVGFRIIDINAYGGDGGAASGTGSTAGAGGNASTSIKLIDCDVTGTISHVRGAGGTATGSGSTNGANGAGTGTLKTWNSRKGTITSPLGTQTHTNELTAPDVI